MGKVLFPKLGLLFTLLLTTAACDNSLQFKTADLSLLPVDCNDFIPGQLEIDLQKVGQVGDKIKLSAKAERAEVVWHVTSPSGQILRLNGNNPSLSLDEVGEYTGEVGALYSCDHQQSASFSLDSYAAVEAASLSINNNDTYTQDVNVDLSLTADNATEMYITDDASCNSGGQWESYNAAKAWVLSRDNSNVKVYAKFKNEIDRETACISDDIIHDNVAPVVSLNSMPPAIDNTNSPIFEFSASDATSGVDQIFCSTDGFPPSGCVSPKEYQSLPEGSRSFSVRAIDKAGNVSTAVEYNWSIDTIKPVVTLTRTPPANSSVAHADFEFTASDVGLGLDRVECQLDNGTVEICTSPKRFAQLADGNHIFVVRAIDKAGNVSDPAEYNWLQDAIGPTVQITSNPNSLTRDKDASFSFIGNDNGSGISHYECQLDNGTVEQCTSPKNYTSLALGVHNFSVVAVDNFGLKSSPATYSWEIESGIIEEDIVVPPGPGGNKVDIIISWDNSASMGTEQIYLSRRFRSLERILDGLDFRLAIINTDRRAPWGGDGRFHRIDGPKLPNPWITHNERNYGLKIRRTMQKMREGSNWEIPIKNTHRALERAENQSFFRDDAHLAVIYFTDADEHGDDPNYNTAQSLIDHVDSKWNGNKTFTAFGLIDRPQDTYCLQTSEGAGRSYIVNDLIELTGGIAGSICRHDYVGQLEGFQNVVGNAGSFSTQLQCVPEDQDGDGEPDIEVISDTPNLKYTLQGDQLVFRPRPAAGTAIKLRYRCP